MGSVTPLGERLRFVPPRLGADIDVLTVARTIAENCAVESPGQIHARIARSGLLALSVPTELGGTDITNDVLSQALAIISAADAAAAHDLVEHFTALEFIRNAGSEDQRKALFARLDLGETFALAVSAADLDQAVTVTEDDYALRLPDDVAGSVRGHADWIVVPAVNTAGQPLLVVLRNRPNTSWEGLLRADQVVFLAQGAGNLAVSVSTLLKAAVALGQKQRELSALLIDRLAGDGAARPVIGEIFLAIELLKAQISSLAANIDAAQVGAENVTFRSVRNNAITLEILMARLGLVEGVSEAGLIASLDDDLRRQ
ncbi:acyl-CoA dehydrogenase [Agrobacterium tumefaciens]|uniref:acyl-CoA dehydrogenase family protein n=1 Tax=Agrobacterium TaxID=357 RepID=UPI00115CFCC0|nr:MULTISPECIES: acyl-CoA dehydrogenase family protein [Agrobacterium]MDA5245246.1 acyl-CoA dehydrogenase family protein [Agrobacterium sp. MAFF310724]MDA5246325.1 acyl-CoA dehydrogenase family protein [Agrobacterium sp. MAFF210268]TRB17560.1 acyl-CoA dehydrogenase [Agrobacterium tumefaciens]